MLEIDGSYLEGGGQIVRTALALSTHLQIPCKITNIRSNRPTPGLKHQHLYCIRALQKLCNAKVFGDHLKSTELTYIPGELKAKNIKIDIQTAGSITLLFQSLLVPCVLQKKPLTIEVNGGTDVKWSPSIDYFKEVVIPQFRRFADIDCKILQRGFYPKGGGIVNVRITPCRSLSIDLDKKIRPIRIRGNSVSTDEKKAYEMAHIAREILKKTDISVAIDEVVVKSLSKGSVLTLYCLQSENDETDFLKPCVVGSDTLDDAKGCAEKLIERMGTPVDENLCDHLIPLMGLVGGIMKTNNITDHTKTNIYVTEKFVGKKFEVNENTITFITQTTTLSI